MAAQNGQLEGFPRREALVLRLAECLTLSEGTVSDELYAELQHEFHPEELVELVAGLAWKNYLARFNRVYQISEDEYPLPHL